MSLDRAPPGSAASPERDALYREYPMWTDPARPGWLRRHKTLVAVGVVALLLVISAGVIAAITTARSDSGDAANAESIARTPSAASPIDPTASPSPTATVSPSPSPASTAFPNAANTGVPEGTNLTAYTGPCTITAANTAIVEKIVNCDLAIRAVNVVIRKSRIKGLVIAEGPGFSFRMEDSEVDASPNGTRQATGVGAENFVVLRSEIRGGNRGVLCQRRCEVRDSWIHGTKLMGDWHGSAIRMEQDSVIVHNTLACDWTAPLPESGGCSADLTGYADFAPIRNNLIERNLFVANPVGVGYCAYGGATAGKPFSSDPGNATGIRFIGNVFQRGPKGKCGTYGPITSFDTTRSGNRWEGNVWDDGGIIKPEN